jgi:nucleotide-binding universal stress UspA family protein
MTRDEGSVTADRRVRRKGLLVNSHPSIMCRLDVHHPSTDALDTAVALAERLGVDILLVQADGSADDQDGFLEDDPPDSLQGSDPGPGADILRAVAATNIPDHVAVRTLLLDGNAISEILRVARDEEPLMIVLAACDGHHGADARLSAVAVGVATGALCPVLLVPALHPEKGAPFSFVQHRGKRIA